MSHLWSGRFEGEPDPDVFAFGASFAFDRRLFEDDVRGSLAWAEALAGAGVIAGDEAAAIAGGLAAILEEGRRDPAFLAGPDEDVHAFVERRLIERVGEAGRRLHTGRSRNEQVALDLRLYLRRRLRVVRERVLALIAACHGQAERAGDTLMPAYTHLRPAQPILAAHYWLAHAAALRRDVSRLEAVDAEADWLTLGSGAVAGTAYPIDTAALARRLGFSRVVINSLDATSDRDFVASFLSAASLAMVHLSRLCEDLIVFGTDEFGFVELDDRVATGSSLMPQKKNPDPLELVRGKTGRVIGRLAGWLVTMKGLPSGYNKDLQEDKEALFDAEETLLGSLAALCTVVGTLRFRADRASGAAAGFMLATEVADYLVRRGLPFRRAHEVVGRLVRQLIESGRELESLSLEEWRSVSPLFDDDIRQAVTARASVGARCTPQSTRPAAVAAAIAELGAWLGTERADAGGG
jgi:argininosuccinate lyase